MIRRMSLIAAVPLAAAAAPVAAQDLYPAPSETESLEAMAETLSDPARQEELASTVAVMTEILLDLPLAPILEPMAEIAAETTGEPIRLVDPDATLRKIAPGAGRISGEVQDKLPRAMDSVGAMSGAVARMVPALREMAQQLRDTLPSDLGDR
ncbi:hypothetical protein [Qipengyuania sp. MTN3-11]|uniref:hypothetical protein n=1 Tax=Qipengyuania sp. MTN3-11 TaxID=3056557 RepID=UPI0036F43F23